MEGGSFKLTGSQEQRDVMNELRNEEIVSSELTEDGNPPESLTLPLENMMTEMLEFLKTQRKLMLPIVE